jgi:hypothetical protein
MADNTGKETLISVLECICREHRAMCLLLREENPSWRSRVRRLSDSQPNRDAVHNRFREVIDSQQSSPDNVINIDLLIVALNNTVV